LLMTSSRDDYAWSGCAAGGAAGASISCIGRIADCREQKSFFWGSCSTKREMRGSRALVHDAASNSLTTSSAGLAPTKRGDRGVPELLLLPVGLLGFERILADGRLLAVAFG
jgi:hypothetical protein